MRPYGSKSSYEIASNKIARQIHKRAWQQEVKDELDNQEELRQIWEYLLGPGEDPYN